ncbi:DNA phosphorothioation-dependent restriction protein DptF [Methanobrevibacter sp.]|uniref:DNA phosphorothioation-dependent restriction protein DptF n=1 Tax=Methanobrevibacter sp. TaxID=66852 RepID=UPI0038698E40
MESNVFSNPDVAILNGGKYFEDLLSLIMVTELIPEEKTVNDNINKLKEFGILSYEMKDRFHQARIARNKGIHDNANNKYAYQLCALLFQISVWFYKKYSGDKNFRSPSFDRSLIVEKDKKMNQDSKPSNFDENGMRTLLEDVLDEKMKNIMQNIGNNTSTTNEQIPNKNVSKNEFKGNAEVKKASDLEYEFSKTKGSYLLTELSKLKKSSKESIEDSNGFDNEFKKYMHVDREIQYELENKLDELSNNNSSQLIMLSGSVGDGKSHLLSYMKYKHPELMNKFRVHNDATESFDPKLTAIETLKKVLEPFSDVNIEKSNEKLILAINLGILSNLMDDEYIKNNYSKLYEILETVDIFDNSAKTTNITKNFLTIINFTDYQLYEIDEGKASSDFILSLLNKVTDQSDKNPFYLAYKKDLKNKLNTPIIYNYQMLMNNEVKDIIVQTLIKCIIKNKKIISTRELLNFIYEIIVPAEFNIYSNMDDVSKYVDDLLPNLLFNTENRSEILSDICSQSPADIRSEKIDEFIISLNTLNIKKVLNDYFDEEYIEFEFFKDYLLSKTYAHDKSKQRIIKNSLIYFILFFGVKKIKNAFIDEIYNEYLKYLYYYNYNPRKVRKLFSMIKSSILEWRGSIKKDYVIINELPNFIISKRISVDFKPNKSSETNLKNNFKNHISFNVIVNNDFCDSEYCIGDSCEKQKCVKLNVDYLLFEAIEKINKGYKPNKNEKENLIVFDDFIDEILSKKGDNELSILYKSNNSYFKFKSSSGNYYSLESE